MSQKSAVLSFDFGKEQVRLRSTTPFKRLFESVCYPFNIHRLGITANHIPPAQKVWILLAYSAVYGTFYWYLFGKIGKI